jgi:LPXTG-motif cell wall-anchored protein
MRRSRALTLALAGGTALALVVASPAAAASVTWVAPGDTWWSDAGSWSGAAVAATGDDVTFAGGDRSTYNLGNVTFSSFHFTNAHTIANGGGAIGLTNGLTVDAGAPVRIEPGVATSGDQSWAVATGATLTLPSQVDVDPASTLTLQVDGTVDVTTGNLDGGAAACIVKTGAGVLRFASGGGGVGVCGADPEGLRVEAGEVQIVPGANLGGKSFRVAGGTFTGGALGAASVVRQLNLGTGTVSPGVAATDIGAINLWGSSSWTGGSYIVDWNPTTGDADLVHGDNQPISVADTVLELRLAAAATVGDTVTVLDSTVAVSGAFRSPAGAVLADGDEFVSGGQRYEIGYTATAVNVTWLGAVPAAPAPAPAADPTLAETGVTVGTGIAAAGAVLALVGGVLLVRRRRATAGL